MPGHYAPKGVKAPKARKTFAPAIQADKQHKILRELPKRMEQRISNVHARNEMLRAIEAQNLAIERQRVISHIHDMPASLQKEAAQLHVGDLTRRIHELAGKGCPNTKHDRRHGPLV